LPAREPEPIVEEKIVAEAKPIEEMKTPTVIEED
jgi:hypothetical protein